MPHPLAALLLGTLLVACHTSTSAPRDAGALPPPAGCIYGDACVPGSTAEGDNCGSPGCARYCIARAAGGGYCSQPCSSDLDCPGFSRCCSDRMGSLPQKMCLRCEEAQP